MYARQKAAAYVSSFGGYVLSFIPACLGRMEIRILIPPAPDLFSRVLFARLSRPRSDRVQRSTRQTSERGVEGVYF